VKSAGRGLTISKLHTQTSRCSDMVVTLTSKSGFRGM